ncbi:MAG: NADPH:quinone reductase [Fibrella sp.]|nr:NADPH:quinone reductase [Armatimonadota bacterium]
MKAIRIHEFGGTDVLRLEEIDDPTPGTGEIVIAVRAAGVNPVDTYIRAGVYGDRPKPFTPGMDAAGVIESVGANCLDFEPGDRVYVGSPLTGTYAEKVLAKVENVYRLPGNVSFEQGAGIPVPYATAYRALFGKANVRTGETVLVHGASGGVGIAAVQLALGTFSDAKNLTVIGTAGTEEGLQLVREQGAMHVFNHKAPDYTDKIMEQTNGRGVDVILEMLANVNLDKDLDLLAPFGRVVIIGSRGPVEISPRKMMGKDTTITGMTLFNVTPAEIGSIHAQLYTGLMNEVLRPIVGKSLPLADTAKAHDAVMEGGAYGKIVLIP